MAAPREAPRASGFESRTSPLTNWGQGRTMPQKDGGAEKKVKKCPSVSLS